MPPMLKPKRRRAPGRTSRRRIRRPGRRGLLESAQSPIFFESFESVAGNVMSKRVYWILAIAGIAMLLSAAGYYAAKHADGETMHAVHEIGAPGNHHDASEATAWIFPLHPLIHQDHPGSCPFCGMDLVPESHEPATAEASEARKSPRMN